MTNQTNHMIDDFLYKIVQYLASELKVNLRDVFLELLPAVVFRSGILVGVVSSLRLKSSSAVILFKLEPLGILVELCVNLGLSLRRSSRSLLLVIFLNFIQSENILPRVSFLVCFLEVESLRHNLGHGVVITFSLFDVRTNDFQLVVFLQTSLEHVVLGSLDGHGVVGLIGGDPQSESADDSLMESATVHGQFPVGSLQLALPVWMKNQKWN